MRSRLVIAAALLVGIVTGHAQQTAHSRTLENVRATGHLHCGIIQEDAEYSTEDDHGSRGSFDVDLCKAFAIAAIGRNATLSTKTFLDSASALEALRAGKVDVIPSVSADFSHATAPGIRLSPPIFYDSVGLLARRSAKVERAAQLSGKPICFLDETAVETELRSWFGARHLDFVPFPFQEEGEMEAAFVTGNCTALAGDLTRLVNTRSEFGSIAGEYALLPDMIAADPLASATRSDDAGWSNLVTWVNQCLILAEDLGITASTAQDNALPPGEAPAKLLGRTHDLGAPLGLPDDWFLNVLNTTGNFGQIYDRAFGPSTNHALARGPNQSWNKGGLFYALPLK